MLCVLRTRVSSLDGLRALALDGRLAGAHELNFCCCCCLRRDLKMKRSSLAAESSEWRRSSSASTACERRGEMNLRMLKLDRDILMGSLGVQRGSCSWSGQYGSISTGTLTYMRARRGEGGAVSLGAFNE